MDTYSKMSHNTKYDIQNGVNWAWCRMSIMQGLCTYRQEDHQFKSSSPLLRGQDQSETKEIPANQTKKKTKTREQHSLKLIFSFFLIRTTIYFPSSSLILTHFLPSLLLPIHGRPALSTFRKGPTFHEH